MGDDSDAFLNDRIELVQINRLDKMMLEPCFLTSTHIILHSETGESNPEQRLLGPEPLNKINSTAIRQSKIADKYIKFRLSRQIKCRIDIRSRLNIVAAVPKPTRKRPGSIRMVLDKQDAQGVTCRH